MPFYNHRTPKNAYIIAFSCNKKTIGQKPFIQLYFAKDGE